ncbi:MAG: hypothetical protein WKG01_00710 [Kofleriaceae bacterium]
MALQYKFVEVTPVTDETLERAVNEWVANDWHLEGIRFVTTEHSKRPSLAFVSFVREADQAVVDSEPPRKPPALLKPEAPPGEPAVIVASDHDAVD